MLEAICGSDEVLAAVQAALGPGRLSIIIGIDGLPGSGKTSLATWLSQQLGCPVIPLDAYLDEDGSQPVWRYSDLNRALTELARPGQPVIMEGARLCAALQDMDLEPGILIWMENSGGREHGPEEVTDDYVQEFDPEGNADFTLRWRQPEAVSDA